MPSVAPPLAASIAPPPERYPRPAPGVGPPASVPPMRVRITTVYGVLAMAGPRTGRDVGMAVGLLVLVTVQIALVGSRESAPGLAALHPVLALAAMGLAVHMGMHVLRRGRREPVAPARA